MIKIGQTIKAQRNIRGLTQKDLAQRIGRTESSIRKYEKGLVDIPHKVINEIADALEIPFIDLLYPDEESKIAANNHVEKAMANAFYELEESRLDLALKQILLGDFTESRKRLSANANFEEVFTENYSREKLRNLPPKHFEKCFKETSLDIYEKAVIFAMIRDSKIAEFSVVNFYEYVNYIKSIELSKPSTEFDQAFINLYKRIGYNNAPTYKDVDLISQLITKKYDVIKALNGVIRIIDGVESIPDTLMPGEYEKIYYLFKNIESTIIAELSQKKDK